MKYTEPTGHCVNSQTTNGGDAIDYDNADCRRYANTIANMWDRTNYWSNRFGVKENFFKDVAADATNGTDFFQLQLSSYLQSAEYQGKNGQFSASSTTQSTKTKKVLRRIAGQHLLFRSPCK